jgi:bacterioferritin (cytochrome b1)
MLRFHRTILFILAAILLAGVFPLTAAAQPYGGPGMGMGHGRGMGMRGMMGGQVNIPDKLPAPKNQEWLNKLRDILSLEKLSVAQYSADQAKYQAGMPYNMILRQEDWHVNWITSLFKAYGLPAEAKTPAITPTNSLKQAFEVCLKLETDLIPQYEWLIKNATDQTSAQVLTTILQQTRMHLHMFQRHLQMLGGA